MSHPLVSKFSSSFLDFRLTVLQNLFLICNAIIISRSTSLYVLKDYLPALLENEQTKSLSHYKRLMRFFGLGKPDLLIECILKWVLYVAAILVILQFWWKINFRVTPRIFIDIKCSLVRLNAYNFIIWIFYFDLQQVFHQNWRRTCFAGIYNFGSAWLKQLNTIRLQNTVIFLIWIFMK